eukprot:13241238-Alexandrium_andersonii.AAC.1
MASPGLQSRPSKSSRGSTASAVRSPQPRAALVSRAESPATFAESTAPSWTQRWVPLVVLSGTTRWRPAPDA